MSEVIDFSEYRKYNPEHTAKELGQLASVTSLADRLNTNITEIETHPVAEPTAINEQETEVEPVRSVYDSDVRTPEDIRRDAYEQFGSILPTDEIEELIADTVANVTLKNPLKNKRLLYRPEEKSKY